MSGRSTSRLQAIRALLRARSGRGQSVVEVAVFLPLLLIFGLACIQFAVIFMAYMNLVNATRDAARWVTVHPNTTDGSVQTTIRNRRTPGMVDTNLFVTFLPACENLSAGICPNRTRDTMLVTTGRYVVTSHIFLPTSFGYGNWVVRIPIDDLTYTLRMQVEPL